MNHTISRRLRVVATGVLGAGLALGALAPAPASAAPTAAARSGGWLAGQLTDGLMHNNSFGGFDDYGLTADTGFALADLGVRKPARRQIRKALASHVQDWTTYNGDVFSGSTAKALVLAQVSGARPRDFGGTDLVAQLENRVATTGTTRGRLQDQGANDYANTIGQAFAARGLARIGSDQADAVTSFLLQQQCGEGFFRLQFSATDSPTQSCDADTSSAPSADVTALALVQLQAVDQPGPQVQAAIRAGLGWLGRHQNPNGSLSQDGTRGGANTNTTGLAAWALGQGGRCAKAQDAARWTQRITLGNGAMAYDRAAYTTARADGIDQSTRDQFRRATSQAAPGLTYLNLRACRG